MEFSVQTNVYHGPIVRIHTGVRFYETNAILSELSVWFSFFTQIRYFLLVNNEYFFITDKAHFILFMQKVITKLLSHRYFDIFPEGFHCRRIIKNNHFFRFQHQLCLQWSAATLRENLKVGKLMLMSFLLTTWGKVIFLNWTNLHISRIKQKPIRRITSYCRKIFKQLRQISKGNFRLLVLIIIDPGYFSWNKMLIFRLSGSSGFHISGQCISVYCNLLENYPTPPYVFNQLKLHFYHHKVFLIEVIIITVLSGLPMNLSDYLASSLDATKSFWMLLCTFSPLKLI